MPVVREFVAGMCNELLTADNSAGHDVKFRTYLNKRASIEASSGFSNVRRSGIEPTTANQVRNERFGTK
jgi:hypothetical protein